MDKPRRGRPRSDSPRSKHIDVRVTAPVYAACEAAADRLGLALSSWCSIVLTDAARWHGSPAAPGAPRVEPAADE